MDENKGKDVACLGGSVSECTVVESAEQTLDGSVEDFPVPGHNEGSLAQNFEVEPCNGDDIMVEVLGSEVYVGGVCTSGSGENLDDDGGEMGRGPGPDQGERVDDAGVVSERLENDSGRGDGSVVCGLDLREAGVSGGGGVSQEAEIQNEGDLVVAESVEEKDRVSVVLVTTEVTVEEVAVEDTREESGFAGAGGVEVSEVGDCVVAGSSGGEMKADHVAEVELITKEVVVEGEMREVDENIGSELVSGGGDASLDVSKQEIEVLDSTASDPGIRNGDGAGLSESQIVNEDAVMVSAELGSGLASKAVGQDNNVVDDKVETCTDLATQKVGVSEEADYPGSESMATKSATVESSSAEPQVLEESSLAVNEMGLNPDIPLEDQGQVAVGGEVFVVDKEVVICSTVSVMEIDSEGEKVSGLVEKEEVKGEIGGDTAENHNADSESSHQPTQVVVESGVTVTVAVSISEQDKSLEPEEYFDNRMACDITQVESNSGEGVELDIQVMDAEQVEFDAGQEGVVVSDTEVPRTAEQLNPGDNMNKVEMGGVSPVCANTSQEVEVNEETSDAHQVGLHGGQQAESEKQQVTVDELGGITEKEGHVDEDATSLDQRTQVVGAECTTLSDGVPNSVNENLLPPPSGNGENLQPETLERTTETENQVNDDVDVAPMDTDEVLISEFEILEHPDTYQRLNNEEYRDQGVTTDSGVSQRNIAEEADHKEEVAASDSFGSLGEQDLAVIKEVPDDDQLNTSEQKVVICESLESESSSGQQPVYELPPEHEGVFSVPDLVWGKVKSHPWWPGQIFDFTDASEKAMKHHKKDCFLVAYFGDRTFAWNEASTLKSFRTHFSQTVAQCNGETFQNAVRCALEEVSRRVELGLACSCIPKDSYDDIRLQIVENAGIRSESSRRDGVDESAGVSFLRTDKLIEYVKALAQSPSDGSDHLGLAIAKAQLLAFGRFKGYCSLPEFQFCGELVENDTVGPRFRDIHPGDEFEHGSPLSKDDEQASSSQEIQRVANRSSHKRKHNLRDSPYPKLKEKSLSELMGGSLDYPDDDNLSGKRRKSADGHADDSTTQDGRKTSSLAKNSNSTPPKQSFKIGECIRRVASQLTGSPSMKGSIERVQKADGSGDRPGDEYDISLQSSEGKSIDPTEYSSLDELLFQLQFIAQDPLKEHNFSNVIINFFSDFRNSVIGSAQHSGTQPVASEKVGAKRKKGSPETFEFDDMNDTYWTDRVIQNGAEEQPSRRNKKKDNQLALVQPEKTPQEGRRPYNRKRMSNGDHAVTPQKPPGYISENAPTELIMNFSEMRSVPTESNLNKMFRRFGPLKETETEVDGLSSRARVIFKKCSDAEIAFNSAGKFNIFGPTLVNYELSYTPTVQFKPLPVVITQDHDTQLNLSAHDHEMQLDLSTHEHEMHLDLSAHDHEMQLDLSNLSEFEVNLV